MALLTSPGQFHRYTDLSRLQVVASTETVAHPTGAAPMSAHDAPSGWFPGAQGESAWSAKFSLVTGSTAQYARQNAWQAIGAKGRIRS